MEKELIAGAVGTGLSVVGTATQTNEILQTISLIITIVGGLITFIIVPLINWYITSKKDGKIDVKEIKDACEIVVKGGEKIKEDIDRKDK